MTLKVPVHTTTAYPGSRTVVSLILNLSTRRLFNCTPQPLYTGQRAPVPTGTVGRVSPTANLHVLENRKISCTCQESNCIPSTPQPSHYTDWAIPLPRLYNYWNGKLLFHTADLSWIPKQFINQVTANLRMKCFENVSIALVGLSECGKLQLLWGVIVGEDLSWISLRQNCL
jgi:hypothetical protein